MIVISTGLFTLLFTFPTFMGRYCNSVPLFVCDNFYVWTLSYKILVLYASVRSIIDQCGAFPGFQQNLLPFPPYRLRLCSEMES